MKISIDDIKVKEGRRRPDTARVKELADSIRELGLLNPITIDKGKNLIAGLHRMEAARLLGWTEVECIMSSLEGLKAELAEIDENIVRSGLSAVEYGEILLRRKEIYETLHPETKHGGDRKSEEIKRTKCPLDSAMSFVDDTAEKLGVAPRTVRRQIQTAKNLTADAKEIIKDSDARITKKEAMKLSRLESERQKEAAYLLVAKEIKSVDEYAKMAEETRKSEVCGERAEKRMKAVPEEMSGKDTAVKGAESEVIQGNVLKEYGWERTGEVEIEHEEPERKAKKEPRQQPFGEAGKKEQKESPDKMGEHEAGQTGKAGETVGNVRDSDLSAVKGEVSFKEIVADLKNMDKDCSGTPESFLAEFDAFVEKFRREIEWYDDSYFDPAFVCMSERELVDFRRQADSIHDAVDRLYEKIERMMKDGK